MKPTKRPKHSELAAIEDCKRRLRVQLTRGNYSEAAEILNTLGNQQRLLGHYEDALENHQQEVTICKTHNRVDRMGLGIAYRNIAEVYIDMKQGPKAISAVKKYLELAREVDNCVEEQRAMITMGRAHLLEVSDDDDEDDGGGADKTNRRTTLLKSAEEWFRKAYSLLTKDTSLKDQLKNDKEYMTMKCNNCQNLGVTLEMQGNSQAVRWFLKAIEIGKQHDLVEYLQPCHAALCNLYLKVKQPQSALTSAREAVKVACAMGSVAQEVEGKLLLARASFLCDNIEAAKKLLKKLRKKVIAGKDGLAPYLEELNSLLLPGIKLSRKLDQLFSTNKSDATKMMRLHESIADQYAELNVFAFAIENYLKAVKFADEAGITGRKLSSLYFSIAESYKDYDEFEKALEFYTKEMSLYDDSPVEKFKTQTHITQILEKWRKGEPQTMSAHQEAIRLAELTRSQKRVTTAYQNYGMYLKCIGDSRADSTLKKAQEMSQDLSQDLLDSQDDIISEDGDSDQENIDLDNLSSDGSSGEDEVVDSKNVAHAKKRITKRKNEAGETPLHIAAKKGDLTGVRKYLRQGFDINARDTAGWTPLHEAANFGFAKVVTELIDHGARVNDPGGHLCDGITPLHDALGNGHFEVAHILLEKGANVIVKDKMKNFPIDQLIIWRNGVTPEELDPVHQEYHTIKQLLKEKMQQKGHPYTCDDERRATKKGQTRSKSPQFTLLRPTQGTSSSSSLIPVRIANDSFDPDDADDATNEYKNAMRSLRSKKTSSSFSRKKATIPNARPISPGPRNALIPSEKDVHEDWMISDSQVEIRRPVRKKRKQRSRSRSREDELRTRDDDDDRYEELKSSSEDETQFNDVEVYSSFPPLSGNVGGFSPSQARPSLPTQRGRIDDDYDHSFIADERSRSRSRSPSPSLRINRRNNRSRSRSPLTPVLRTVRRNSRAFSFTLSDEDNDNGASGGGAYNDDDDLMEIDEPLSPVILPFRPTSRTLIQPPLSTITRISRSTPPVPTTSTTSTSSGSSVPAKRKRDPSNSILRLKIRVLDHLLLVPVDAENRTNSISWLCEQAALRYKQSYGVKPNLSLSTQDGALICLSDRIDIVLDDTSTELIATVLSYDTPATSTRFQLACTDLGLTPRPALLSALKASETSGTLDLTGHNLHGLTSKALFRSLHTNNSGGGDSSLKVLLLSECSLFDNDIEKLATIFGTLSCTLSRLDLSCNAITHVGVRTLCNGLQQTCSFSSKDATSGVVVFGLKELDLSLNPLGTCVATSFAKLSTLLPNLTELKTKACNISGSRFYSFFTEGGGGDGVSLGSGSNAIRGDHLDFVDLDLLRSFPHHSGAVRRRW